MAAPPYPAYGAGMLKPRGWVCTYCRMAAPPYPAYGSGLLKPCGWVCTDCRMAAPPYPAYGSGLLKTRGGYARIAGWRLRLIWPTGQGC
jgi:hypothetical protein